MGVLSEKFQEVQKRKIAEEEVARLEALLKDVANARGPKGEKGDKGDKGDSIVGPAGPIGPMGPKPVAGVDYKIPKNGKDGKDGVGIQGPPGQTGKDGSPDTPEQIADKLNTLTEEVNMTVIKGLKSEILRLEALANRVRATKSKKGGGGDVLMIEDLSSLTDGNTKTFTVPYSRKAIKVEMSDAPFNLYEGNGFTLDAARTTLTLTVINAPTSGSQLGYQYVL